VKGSVQLEPIQAHGYSIGFAASNVKACAGIARGHAWNHARQTQCVIAEVRQGGHIIVTQKARS
ncbi:hypothetical protein, partial [Escherichia coli]|uniref:hypothetical protein n=1 Tax=Escherichia coli TaxID=562 RepID=UPI0030798D75